MRLLDLTLSDFRNLRNVTLEPSPHATVAVGPNGQGKTNLLEGLYYLITLKPLRSAKLVQLIRFGAESARVTGTFELGGAKREVSVQLFPSVRQAFVDGKKAATLEDYFGGVAAVAFTPDDLQVIKGGPDSRRQLLDRAVFNRFPAYLNETREYLRALKSRNRLLKERSERTYLEVYDEALSRLGARLWTRRRSLLHELAPRAQKAFDAIGRTASTATYRYEPTYLPFDFSRADEAVLRSSLLELLVARTARDTERGFTSVGPHVDDVDIRLADTSARAFASQGQQRALILAWKIGEIENLHATLGHLPLLLLDDVSSELDPERNAFLMEYLAQSGSQVFLTTTDGSLVRRAVRNDARWYTVEAGNVLPEKTQGVGS